jgi:hypothetical protein
MFQQKEEGAQSEQCTAATPESFIKRTFAGRQLENCMMQRQSDGQKALRIFDGCRLGTKPFVIPADK